MKEGADGAEVSRGGGPRDTLRATSLPSLSPRPLWPCSLVSVVSYWLSRCSSKMSTSTRAFAGTSMIPLICSRARARARRSPRPHTVWSSRIAAEGTQGLGARLSGPEGGGFGVLDSWALRWGWGWGLGSKLLGLRLEGAEGLDSGVQGRGSHGLLLLAAEES